MTFVTPFVGSDFADSNRNHSARLFARPARIVRPASGLGRHATDRDHRRRQPEKAQKAASGKSAAAGKGRQTAVASLSLDRCSDRGKVSCEMACEMNGARSDNPSIVRVRRLPGHFLELGAIHV